MEVRSDNCRWWWCIIHEMNELLDRFGCELNAKFIWLFWEKNLDKIMINRLASYCSLELGLCDFEEFVILSFKIQKI